MDRDLRADYGPWAIVAGAGAGLGEAYARQLAGHGLCLVLIDRDTEVVQRLALALTEDHDISCRTVALDLASPDAPDIVMTNCASLDVGLFVANAAASHVGPFRDQDPESFELQLRVNALTPTVIIHRLLPHFTARERAGVILMSSLSSRRGAPLVATYAATKAYLAILAESLWDELRDDGIDVLGVLPGSTRTPGWLSSNPQAGTGTTTLMDPGDVVGEALAALGAGRPTLVPGGANRESESFLESMDRTEAVRMVGQVMREMYPVEREPDPTL
ncbi:MAG: SDR family NAD(P)-dependent oxidoreductase [Acidimicrobiales bacterium]